MSIQNLLHAWLFILMFDVPNFEFAALSADEQVILIDLVKTGGCLLVLNRFAEAFAAGLDIDNGKKNLLALEAGDCQHRG